MYVSKALQHIIGNNNPSTDELMGLAQQYPYFAVPQVLLLLQQKNNFSSTSHIQKLQVFSPNNTWLQFVLNETAVTEPVLKSIDDIQFEKNKLVEPINNYDGFEDDTANLPIQTENSPEVVVPENNPTSLIAAIEPTITNTVNNIATQKSVLEELPVFEPVHFVESATANATTTVQPTVQNTSVQEGYKNGQHNINTTIPGSTIEVPSLETVRQLLQGKTPGSNGIETAVINNPEPIVSILEQPIASHANTSIPNYQFNGFNNGTPYSNSNAVQLSEEYSNTATIEAAEAEEELQHQHEPLENSKLSSVLNKQLNTFNQPIEANAKLDFETEPFYTVDYFASQGIKIDLTQATQDKLTVQLRRFTDWLKQMKNSNPNPTDLGTDPELEKAIQQIAKSSLEAREIVTETMADVFIKQGKVDKAIQLYIKLSFLDPHKSTYFAKKIEQLKGF
jgi:hypothetical protein